MNPVSTHPDWLSLVGLIALEVTVMVGAAAVLHFLTRAAGWRRTIWHVCLLGLAGLVMFELTGAARCLAGWVGNKLHAQPWKSGQAHRASPGPASETLLLSEHFRRQVDAGIVANQPTRVPEPSSPEAAPQTAVSLVTAEATQLTGASEDFQTRERDLRPVRFIGAAGRADYSWLGAIWLLGAAAILFRVVIGRLLFIAFRWRRQIECDRPLQDRVQELARRVGIRRRVLVLELSKLPSPIAFGIFRPSIGLPPEFQRNFNRLQQDAMVAHELAHLAVHDPAWGILADAVVTTFWWHPLAWWARRQLCAANETAADEASLLIADGPNVLAECLVELGNRLSRPRSFGWMAIGGNGYRSALGNRVERLLHLTDRSWRPLNGLRYGLAKTIGPVALLTAVVLCTATTHPSVLNEGDTTMKLIDQSWKKSVVAFALAATLGTENRAALADGEKTSPANKVQSTTIDRHEADLAVTATHRILSSEEAVRNEEALILAKQRFDDGKLSEAEHLLRKILELDPTNQSSTDLLKKIETRAESILANGKAGNRAVPGSVQLDPQMAARYGLRADNSPAKARVVETRPSRRAVESKLEQIAFEESTAFEGIPLSEVVKDLDNEARKRDPEKHGINFIISNSPKVSSVTVDPLTGQPITATPGEPVDLNNVIIKLNALRHVRLRDVLDALTKVASQPIQFSVEDYGVVFSRSSSSPVSVASTEENPQPLSMSERMMERYGMKRYGVKEPATESEASGSPPSENGRHAVQTRLEQLTFDQLPRFDGVPLVEVIRNLDDEVRKRDPEKHGINFIISNSLDAQPSSAIDPNTGLPIPAEPVDLNSVTIKLAALRHVRLSDVLDAITKVADHPIKYTVEEYGVVLSRKAASPDIGPAQLAPAAPLQVRTFHVDTNTFLKGLESAFGITVNNLTNKSTAVRRLFQQLGVNMDVPGKTVFYNDLTGVLMVRATKEDLEIVHAAIETLGGRAAAQRRTVSVLGSVNKPDVIEVPEGQPLSVLDAIARAGGVTRMAKEVRVTRLGEPKPFRFNLRQLMENTVPEKVFALEPGDTIFVPASVF